MKKLKKIRDSCAICALWYVAGIDEGTAIRICRANGFKEGKGMSDTDWRKAADLMSIKMRGIALFPHTLKQFLNNFPKGLYLVGTRDHLFVVDNGIIIDPKNKKPPGLKRMILQAWRVEK